MADVKNLPNFLTDMNAVLSDPGATWDTGKPPNFDQVNKLYFDGRTKVHAPGSLEDLVTNLIKNWEKELGHKIDITQWRTMDINSFRMATNGGPWKGLAELAVLGPYNAFIGECDYYVPSRIDSPTSQAAFRNALSGGFAIEVIEAFSPPPNVIFKWRHWGVMTGSLTCPMRGGKMLELPASGAQVEIFGVSRALLNEAYQIMEIEHFLRPEKMFEQMSGKISEEEPAAETVEVK